MTMSGVWSADGKGSHATQLYKSTSSGEEILGWLDNTTAVMDTWAPLCGRSQLRLYDVVSKQQSMLNNDCVVSASVNSLRGEALFATTIGQYLLTADDRKPVLVSHDLVRRIDLWRSYKDIFIARLKDGGLDTFGGSFGSGEMSQQVSPIKAPSESLDVAEFGAIWGWTSKDDSQPGVWISGPGMDIGQIFKNKAHLPIWDSQNNLLFFAPKDGGGESIYRTTFNANYKDLSVVASINTNVHFLAWMGGH